MKSSKKAKEAKINQYWKFIEDKFLDNRCFITNIFFDIVCYCRGNNNFTMNDLRSMTDTPEKLTDFVRFFKSPDFIGYEHYLNHWTYQEDSRVNRWNKIIEYMDERCKEVFGTHWGNQVVPDKIEEIPQFKPLIEIKSTKDIMKNMINRPLYKKDKLIGYIKKITKVQICVGHKSEIDPVDGDFYPDVPIYDNYRYSIVFYNKPNLKNPHEENGVYYLLKDSLDSYQVESDRVLLID